MTPEMIIDVGREAIWTASLLAAPLLLSALAIGLIVGMVQAATQIQEMTLTFIPKIIVILLVTALTGSFIGSQIFAFATEAYGHIATGF
jgi:flagellar biosynthetic protein FliQ